MDERRRDARFFASFWVSISGVNDELEVQKGNVSASGIFFRTDKDAGPPGTVRLLYLATADRRASVEVMAHVVRVISYDDLLQGRVVGGVAFEFLLETPHQREEVERFVREVAEDQMNAPGNAPLDYSFPAQVQQDAPAESKPATVSELSLGGMVLETDWPVEPGEEIRAEVHTTATQRAVRLAGRAVASKRATGESDRYRVAVRFGDDGPGSAGADPSLGASMTEAMNALLSDVTAWRQPESRSTGIHLNGKLSQVRLSSLLSFLDLERTSGVLDLTRGKARATLLVRESQIVGLEMQPPGLSPSKILADLMEWSDGEFGFRFEPVVKEDAVGISISALLMHMARRKDETAPQG